MAAIKASKAKKAVCRKCRRLEKDVEQLEREIIVEQSLREMQAATTEREIERLERELIAVRLAALQSQKAAIQEMVNDSLVYLPAPEKVDEFTAPEPAPFVAMFDAGESFFMPGETFVEFSQHRTFMESAPAAPVAALPDRQAGIVKRLQAAVSQMSRYEQVVSFVAVFGLPVALIVGFAVFR